MSFVELSFPHKSMGIGEVMGNGKWGKVKRKERKDNLRSRLQKLAEIESINENNKDRHTDVLLT